MAGLVLEARADGGVLNVHVEELVGFAAPLDVPPSRSGTTTRWWWHGVAGGEGGGDREAVRIGAEVHVVQAAVVVDFVADAGGVLLLPGPELLVAVAVPRRAVGVLPPSS